MLRGLWLFLLPALAAMTWQLFALARVSSFDPTRAAAAGLTVLLTIWVWMARGRAPRALILRLLLATGISTAFWISALEILVGRKTPLALGLLALITGAAVHATILLAITRPATGNSPAAALLLRAAVFACALGVALTGVEGALRAMVPLNSYMPVADDPDGGRCLIRNKNGRSIAVPGFRGQFVHPQFPGIRVEINDWGLRDGLDEARPPEPGAVSILTLGDSFLFGTGVALEDMFAEQLEARATEFSDRPVRIYNGGIPGYGAIHIRLRLRELASRVKPQVVIAAIFEDNDFQDNWGAQDLWDEVASEADMKATRALGDAHRKSQRTLGVFLDTIQGFRYWGSTSALVQITQLEVLLLDLGLINPVVNTNLFLNICLMREPPPLVSKLRDATFDQLERIRDHCTELGAELVVLLIPSVIQADRARFESFLALQDEAERDRFARTVFHDDLAARLKKRGFTVADTMAGLETETAAGHPCYHREGHWNATGNAVATETLIPVLKKLLSRN